MSAALKLPVLIPFPKDSFFDVGSVVAPEALLYSLVKSTVSSFHLKPAVFIIISNTIKPCVQIELNHARVNDGLVF